MVEPMTITDEGIAKLREELAGSPMALVQAQGFLPFLDTLDAARARVRELEEALTPFVADGVDCGNYAESVVTPDELERARALLHKESTDAQ